MQLQDLATHNWYARLLLPKISNLLIEENFKLLARIVSRKVIFRGNIKTNHPRASGMASAIEDRLKTEDRS